MLLASQVRELASTSKRRHAFTFVDLFAGIGGFHLGLRTLGGRCVFSNEHDRFAAATYWAWTGEGSVETADVRDLDHGAIEDHDVLCAGFPCQPFSLAGVSKKNSLGLAHGFDDRRQGNLFFTLCDVVETKRPPVLFLENVKHIRAHDGGSTFAQICTKLERLGYSLNFEVIDAIGWVPQHRERLFFVCFDRAAFTNDEIDSFEFPNQPGSSRSLEEVLEQKPDRKYTLSDPLWTYLQNYAAEHRARGNGFGFGLVGPGDTTRTLSARYYKDGSEILVRQSRGRNPRRLTPREATLLMGFDDRFALESGFPEGFPQIVSDVQAYKQLGNSVSPLVTEAIGKQILKVLRRRRRRLSAK
jgi:DNA (cytosine-5)-methyltransferase 1